jgi:hypothetical protein
MFFGIFLRLLLAGFEIILFGFFLPEVKLFWASKVLEFFGPGNKIFEQRII